jgi:hypothetical protein
VARRVPAHGRATRSEDDPLLVSSTIVRQGNREIRGLVPRDRIVGWSANSAGVTFVAAGRISDDARSYAYSYARHLLDLFVVDGLK